MAGKWKPLLIGLAVVLLAITTGCDPQTAMPAVTSPSGSANETDKASTQQNGNETMQLVVYHATKDAAHVAAERHVVPKSSQPAKAALELLIAGPTSADLVKVMPDGTKLRGLDVKGHIAYVDFSDKIIKNNPGGSATEMLLVGAIVDTLTEFPDIRQVQILVEGKKVDTLTGHMDLSEPLSRADKLIRKQ